MYIYIYIYIYTIRVHGGVRAILAPPPLLRDTGRRLPAGERIVRDASSLRDLGWKHRCFTCKLKLGPMMKKEFRVQFGTPFSVPLLWDGDRNENIKSHLPAFDLPLFLAPLIVFVLPFGSSLLLSSQSPFRIQASFPQFFFSVSKPRDLSGGLEALEVTRKWLAAYLVNSPISSPAVRYPLLAVYIYIYIMYIYIYIYIYTHDSSVLCR